MDESLDDYISKANFKVKIGNPNYKGNKPNLGNKRKSGFQPIRPITAPQGSEIRDVSVTVPGVQKTGGNINRTNQIRDARERIIAKGKPQDARQKIQERGQGVDARQKITMKRIQVGPQDARAKLQAMKQQNEQTVTGPDGFSLTRTVSNNGKFQMAPQGAPADFQITKTLTKIMPPGYEGLVEGPIAQPTLVLTEQPRPSAKQRLGQKQGPRMTGTVNVIRTVPTNLPVPGHDPQRPPPVIHQPYPPPHLPPGPLVISQSPPFPSNVAPVRYAPTPVHFAGAAPPPHLQPTSHVQYVPTPQAPPPSQHAPPIQYAPPHSQPPYPQHTMPPQRHVLPPPQQMPPSPEQTPPPRMVMTVQNQQPKRSEGPPYPVDDNIPIKRTVAQEIQRRHVPVIQVENDQYRPPQQQYTQYAPPPQPYSAPPPKSYPYAPQSDPVPQQQPYYTQADTSLQRTIPNEELPPPPSSFVKTIVNETAQYSPSSSSVPQLKRKSPGGPLRLSSTNTVPVIAGLDSEEETPKRNTTRYTKPVPQKVDDEPVVKKSKPEVVPESDVISPLQGFKVSIANLHVTVTQDDIIELFGSIGAVKKVRLLKPGTAEVFYVKKEDALNATKTYHERELDGQPMVVKLVTPATAKIKDPPEKLPPSFKPTTTGPLKLSKKPAGMAKVSEKKGVDVSVLHKALFKTGANSSAKPVTFTVNI